MVRKYQCYGRDVLTQKTDTKGSEIRSGMFPDHESQIWIFSIPDPGAKKAPDLGSESATLVSITVPMKVPKKLYTKHDICNLFEWCPLRSSVPRTRQLEFLYLARRCSLLVFSTVLILASGVID